MTEQSHLTPREAELQAAIGETGIGLHRGGFHWDPIAGMFLKPLAPMVAIWGESEVPTPEEIQKLVALGREIMTRAFFHESEIQALAAHGANMHTFFKKSDGTWTYRKLTWSDGPMWYPRPGSLEEISAVINRR